MTINLKKRIAILTLTAAMIITGFSGQALAAEKSIDAVAASSIPWYAFSATLPENGKTVTGTARKKVASNKYASYSLSLVYNNSGLPCYVNVRSSDGSKIVGYAKTVTGTGMFYPSYKSGYGTVGIYYKPSAQTDNDSSKSVSLQSTWTP